MTHKALEADDARSWRERLAWSGLERFVAEQDPAKLVLLLVGQSRVLEMIARSVPQSAVLEELMRVLEEQVDGMSCTVLLLSEDRRHLRHGAAPSIPEGFKQAIDGRPIGARAGSCGTAAFLGQPVIVSDIAEDPLWVDYRDLALEFGFKACWSTPIFSSTGEVLGTFAMYHRQPFSPSPMHLSLLELATHLARVAIERDTIDREHEGLRDAKRFADQYRIVLQATGDAVWDLDLESGAVLWAGGLDRFGYAPGEAVTVDWWLERVHPADVERVRGSFDRAIDPSLPVSESDQSHWDEEYRFRRADGTYAEVIDRALVVSGEAGRAVRMVGSMQDITKRKQHELEMEQLAERFRSATAAAAVGTWRFDLSTKLFLADESLNQMLGGKEEQVVAHIDDVMRAVHRDDRARVSQAIEASIATGRPYQCDHRIVSPNGEVRWFRSRGRVFFDGQGRPLGMIGALADVTELKHAEQSMAILADASRLLAESLESEQILSIITQMVVPAFSDGAVIHLKDPQTTEPRLSLVHAADPELLVALQELQRDDAFRVAAPSRRVMETGRPELHPQLTSEWLFAQDVDAKLASLISRFHLSSTIHVPIMVEGKPHAVVVFGVTGTRVYNERDLAFAEELARRASNAMRNAALFRAAKLERARAEDAAALRERLVAIVGHDLRNPLASISMAAEILRHSALPESEERLASRILSTARRMTRMIVQVLDHARIRAGLSFELRLEPAELHQICESVVDELRLSRPEHEITLNVDGSGAVRCDADRIAQVLSNLVGNAIQHGTSGPIDVTVCDEATDSVAIEIHNVGPPIPQAAQAGIFDAFRRQSPAGGRQSQGLGLGLFIAREIVSAHGGSIAVRSPDRNGTTFRVVLPRKPADLG